jgi:hypothetical protein
MRYDYSMRLRDDVGSAVQAALKAAGIVNITVVAEQVRIRNLAENVALEDIEYLVLQAAQLVGAAIEFDGFSTGLGLTDDGDDRASVSFDLPQSVSIQ